MIYELVIKKGQPDREGNFLYIADYGEGLDVRTLEFIPGYGWNATRDNDGEVNAKFVFPDSSAYIGWADLSKGALTTVEILQDIRDEVEKLRESDPANRGEDYCSESEMWHYNNVDELADHLEQAIGYAKELKGDLY